MPDSDPMRPSAAYEALGTAKAAVYGAPGVVEGAVVTSVSALEGLRALRSVRELIDALEVQLIAKARESREHVSVWSPNRARYSWAEISDALGVPKSVLHRRHGDPPPR